MKELFDKVTVPPKVSLWITIVCLVFVLANNKLYLASLMERERIVREAEERVMLRERAISNRELTITLWERELVTREKSLAKARSKQSGRVD